MKAHGPPPEEEERRGDLNPLRFDPSLLANGDMRCANCVMGHAVCVFEEPDCCGRCKFHGLVCE